MPGSVVLPTESNITFERLDQLDIDTVLSKAIYQLDKGVVIGKNLDGTWDLRSDMEAPEEVEMYLRAGLRLIKGYL